MLNLEGFPVSWQTLYLPLSGCFILKVATAVNPMKIECEI
jgi:hypothetical protein